MGVSPQGTHKDHNFPNYQHNTLYITCNTPQDYTKQKMYIVISTCIYCMYQLINQSQWFVKHQKKLWAQDLHEHVHVVYERNM